MQVSWDWLNIVRNASSLVGVCQDILNIYSKMNSLVVFISISKQMCPNIPVNVYIIQLLDKIIPEDIFLFLQRNDIFVLVSMFITKFQLIVIEEKWDIIPKLKNIPIGRKFCQSASCGISRSFWENFLFSTRLNKFYRFSIL